MYDQHKSHNSSLNDEVVTIDNKAEWNAFYDYMIDHDIDPDDFRFQGHDIWTA